MPNRLINKTNAARYISENPEEAPGVQKFFYEYTEKVTKGQGRGSHFGHWLRSHHPDAFQKLYTKWFVPNGDALTAKLFEGVEDQPA